MHPTVPLRAPAGRQRGATVVESMVAFVLLGLATLAAAQLQLQVRWHADVSRQRSEAARLGEGEHESLRAWSSLDAASGATSYAAIADGGQADAAASAPGSNTAYRVVRSVDDASFAGAKLTAVAIEWNDRSGAAQRVVLHSAIGRSDPAWSGALALGAGAGAARGGHGRSPAVPAGAVSVGGGRSAVKTAGTASTAFVFDDASAEAVSRCVGIAATTPTRDLVAGHLVACAGGRWLLVEGTIRFSDRVPPSTVDANDTPPDVGIVLALTGGSYPMAPECSAESMKTVRHVSSGSLRIDAVPIDALPDSIGLATWTDTGDRHVAYRCFVAPRADGRWSGRTALQPSGWTLGPGSADRRVCRFTADQDGSGAIDANIEHPDAYVDVGTALPGQNFLVVRGDQPCPLAPTSGLLATAFGTVQHQP